MPITIDEKFDSRAATESDSPVTELLFVVQGTDDDSVVKGLLAATSPLTYAGLKRESYAVKHLGGGVWDCSVQYSKFESDSQFTFDTGGGNQHISQALETVGGYAAPGEIAANFQGAIGVNQDQIEGTDITVPVFNFTETHYINSALVTGGYKLALFNLTGRVNGSPFKGFAKGEVLFLGASGAKRGFDDWEITFRFAGSPNVTGLSLGNITGINKEGWQYLWVRFDDDEDTSAKTLIKKPISAYVERVYEYGDFSALGIGV